MTLFWVVLLAALRMRNDLLLVFCIPAVFVAMVMGFSMGVYALDTFGVTQAVVSLAIGWFAARHLARRYQARDYLIAIYLVWAVGLVFALVAVSFPDAA